MANSTWGYVSDANQFTGWHGAGSDPNPEWNSCTGQSPYMPDTSWLDVYYNEDLNSNGLGDTQSSYSPYTYAGAEIDVYTDCPHDTNYDGFCDAGGCLELENVPFGFSGEYLELVEHDPVCCDSYVGTLDVDAEGCQAQFDTCGFDQCYETAYSEWCPTYASDLGSAEVQMILWSAQFIDEYNWYLQSTYCERMASSYREYDCLQ